MLLLLLFLLAVPSSVVSQFGSGYTKARNITTVKPVATHDRQRIVGGVETERNEYPFIVTLSRHGQHFCGGSIIGASWVITAAHCASKPDFNLTAGEHDVRKPEGTEQLVRAVKVIRHPNYNPVTYEDDISLVKVDPPFKFTDFVKSFKLPSAHFIATGNVTTAGWGVLEEGSHEVSPVLRKVTIGLFPNIDCVKQYGRDFHSQKMICAGEKNGTKDACQGDSGGPLLCNDHHNRPTLCGIVSFGFGCARPDFSGVYTKTAFYSDWVQWEQAKEANPNSPHVWSTHRPRPINPSVDWGVDFNQPEFGQRKTDKPTITTQPPNLRDRFRNAGTSNFSSPDCYRLLGFFSFLYLITSSLTNNILRSD